MLMNTGSIIRYESWEPIRQGSLPQLTSRLRLGVAENLAAAFDLDLAVADRSRDPAGRLDQEPVADDQITFEAAAYLGLVDRCRALEQAALSISIARQLVSLASTLPSMSSLSQEFTSPERVIPRPTLRQRLSPVGFQRIGQIGGAVHCLA